MPADFLLNATPNHNPLLEILVEYVERTGPIDLRTFRIRDGYLKRNVQGTVDVVIEFALGDTQRGGSNGALWSRLRRHPLYIFDEDNLLPDHAEVTFYLNKSIQRIASDLLKYAPKSGVSPTQKLKDSIASEAGNPKPLYEPLADEKVIDYIIKSFTSAVLRTEDKRKPVDSLSTEPKKHSIEELIALTKAPKAESVILGTDLAKPGTMDEPVTVDLDKLWSERGEAYKKAQDEGFPFATDEDCEAI